MHGLSDRRTSLNSKHAIAIENIDGSFLARAVAGSVFLSSEKSLKLALDAAIARYTPLTGEEVI